ncbi:hypothetical protein M413DRAFT_24568 [Hebeloma cylindrosporum]|uniref:Uncharacterized protein n=1 Tax=Hebeloma cylindrosporum TaxID=76867 RepID=A0A0C2Y662_HEBCY|nr:hypothetical protein M413DRAFT_24568 [Hebeloma cylindrosporum h7]
MAGVKVFFLHRRTVIGVTAPAGAEVRALELLGFNERRTVVATRYAIPLTIGADSNRIVQADVCVLHRPTMVLLVLIEDESLSNSTDAESQVVADAIVDSTTKTESREALQTYPP